MTSDERHERMDAARVRLQLSVQDVWLRYVALGGSSDAFHLDGYLQGLVPLDTFQQEVLAQALNEALEDDYRSYLIPPLTPGPTDAEGDRLDRLVEDLVGDTPPLGRPEPSGS